MALAPRFLKILLLFLNFGGVQVLATGKSALVEIDIKYALIGTFLGVIISACFLALKICMIRRHMFDNNSSGKKKDQLLVSLQEGFLCCISTVVLCSITIPL
uniref:Transmembrane protein 273 n=1 Tax=Monodelphis domestica TaxID=13616 RepID=A0A5F8HFF4_MONDO